MRTFFSYMRAGVLVSSLSVFACKTSSSGGKTSSSGGTTSSSGGTSSSSGGSSGTVAGGPTITSIEADSTALEVGTEKNIVLTVVFTAPAELKNDGTNVTGIAVATEEGGPLTVGAGSVALAGDQTAGTLSITAPCTASAAGDHVIGVILTDQNDVQVQSELVTLTAE